MIQWTKQYRKQLKVPVGGHWLALSWGRWWCECVSAPPPSPWPAESSSKPAPLRVPPSPFRAPISDDSCDWSLLAHSPAVEWMRWGSEVCSFLYIQKEAVGKGKVIRNGKLAFSNKYENESKRCQFYFQILHCDKKEQNTESFCSIRWYMLHSKGWYHLIASGSNVWLCRLILDP